MVLYIPKNKYFSKDLDRDKFDLLPNSGWMLDSDYSIERLNELCFENKVGWVNGRKTAPVTPSTPE